MVRNFQAWGRVRESVRAQPIPETSMADHDRTTNPVPRAPNAPSGNDSNNTQRDPSKPAEQIGREPASTPVQTPGQRQSDK